MGKQEVKTRHGERVAIVAGLRTPLLVKALSSARCQRSI